MGKKGNEWRCAKRNDAHSIKSAGHLTQYKKKAEMAFPVQQKAIGQREMGNNIGQGLLGEFRVGKKIWKDRLAVGKQG